MPEQSRARQRYVLQGAGTVSGSGLRYPEYCRTGCTVCLLLGTGTVSEGGYGMVWWDYGNQDTKIVWARVVVERHVLNGSYYTKYVLILNLF